MSLLLAICLAAFTVAGAETPVVGGWTLTFPAEAAPLDADLVAAFTDAVGDSGLIYVAVIDRQVVAGTNAKQIYVAFQKAFPDLNALRDYVQHDAERGEDPTEGNAYLEMEHGCYWLRFITRKGDYNLYLHALSRAAMIRENQSAED